MPPPSYGLIEPLGLPFLRVKPSSTDAFVSPEAKITTDPAWLPSMIVVPGPASLRTVIALPWKLIFSKYVPGATSTVSPLLAVVIAPWIVGWSAGTLMVIGVEAMLYKTVVRPSLLPAMSLE